MSTSTRLIGTELASLQHAFVGVLYFIGGSFAFFSSLRLWRIFRKDEKIRQSSRVIHMHFLLANMGVVLGFPMSSSSSVAGRWLFGNLGCQMYACEGFISGITAIQLLVVMAIDRYLSISWREFYDGVSNASVHAVCALVWLFSLFWSVLPLLGYGRYDLEPQGTSCTIDWMAKDEAYYTYMTSLVLFAFVVPCGLAIFVHILVSDSECSNNESNVEMQLNKLSRTLFFVSMIAWSPYAVVCGWSVLFDVKHVLLLAAYIPPISAKYGAAIIPLLYNNLIGRMGEEKGSVCSPTEKERKKSN